MNQNLQKSLSAQEYSKERLSEAKDQLDHFKALVAKQDSLIEVAQKSKTDT